MNTLLLATASFTLIGSLWLTWRYKNRRLLKFSRQLPGPKALPILGNALYFICKPEEVVKVIEDLIVKYGAWFSFWLGPELNVIVSDPDDLKAILSNPKMNSKGPSYKYMNKILGEGILSGSGPTWRRHRKIANPNYGKKAIESYESSFNREVDILMETFRSYPHGRKFDVYPPIVQATSYVVCQTLMGLTREETIKLPYIQDIIDCTHAIYDIVFSRMTQWWYQIDPVFWLTKSSKIQNKFRYMTQEFSKAVLKLRRKRLEKLANNDIDLDIEVEEDSLRNTELSVIDRFILSKELNEAELLNETFTIFTSSQEASAKISSSLILMMAYHPQCQEKLYAEIKAVVGDCDGDVTDDVLKNLPYLDMAFKEILRMFPIGAMLQRTVTEDVPTSKGTIPAGASLMAPVYHLHRDPRFWENPNSFDPERFTAENIRKRQPNCYIPFSVGPMDCLGRYFGTKLIKTICVRFLQKYEVKSVDIFEDMKMNIAISASPIDGYNLIMTERNK